MLGAITASETAATNKRFSELLLMYVLLIEILGPPSTDHLEHQSRGWSALLPSQEGFVLITIFLAPVKMTWF
jgi:hypothetical protein